MSDQNKSDQDYAALDEACREFIRRKALGVNLKAALDAALAKGYTATELLARVQLCGAKPDSLTFLACENYLTGPNAPTVAEEPADEQS